MNDETHKKTLDAAAFFNETAKKIITEDGRLHAETLILSMARMSGSLMYRSFGFDPTIAPGTVVLSHQANTEGPKLMNGMLATLQGLGHPISEQSLDAEHSSAKFAHLTLQQSQERLAAFFVAYCNVAPLTMAQGGVAAAIATAILIHECQGVLSVDKGGSLAVFGLVEGTKTAPFGTDAKAPAAAPRAADATKAKATPWYKFW